MGGGAAPAAAAARPRGSSAFLAAGFRRLLLLDLLLVAGLPSAVQGFSSLCRSSFTDPGSMDTTLQCNDAAQNWPVQYRNCLPDNWGLQCAACLQTCYFAEQQGGRAFLPFQYTFPSVESFAQTCDVRATGAKYQNESSLGIYCCKPCKLWRLVTERCGQLVVAADGLNQSCFLEDADAQATIPVLRAQSSLDNTPDAPHWLFIPPTPNRGIEDTRTNFSFFQQAYRLALEPGKYLKPLKDKGKKKRTTLAFDDALIPGRMGPTNVALGLNQANQRSQHQAHIHYAALPTSFRSHILTQARIPPATDPATAPCTPATGLKFGDKSVGYFGWFFPWDLSNATDGAKAKWDFRSLALKQCPQLVETFVRGPDGQLMLTPPPLPFAPPSSGGALPLPDTDDFLMSQVAVIIIPGFSLDPATQRPYGHYVLLGSTGTYFHAETLVCTEWGIKAGWDGPRDCPVTKEGWPAPEPGPPQAAPTPALMMEVEVDATAGTAASWVSTASRLRRPPVEDGEAMAALQWLQGPMARPVD